MKAFIFLATGFEDVEAVGTIDILRRGGIETITVSVTGDYSVTSVHGIHIMADELFESIDFSDDYDALVLPGGGPGSILLNKHDGVRQALVEAYQNGKLVAAICAAPRVLGCLGLLSGKNATCYPGIEPELIGATLCAKPVVVDQNIITGQGPGFVFEFALAILTYLDLDADQIAKDLLLL